MSPYIRQVAHPQSLSHGVEPVQRVEGREEGGRGEGVVPANESTPVQGVRQECSAAAVAGGEEAGGVEVLVVGQERGQLEAESC